jgi:hypothetical protein
MLDKPHWKPELAVVVRAVIDNRGELNHWQEFPQYTCCFTFGKSNSPLPIGALYLLWDRDERWRRPCPYCKGDARGLSCGSFLSIGWFEFLCIDCSASFREDPGGLGSARKLLTSLRDCEFQVSGMKFGGAYGSDGSALLKTLNLSYSPTTRIWFGLHR